MSTSSSFLPIGSFGFLMNQMNSVLEIMVEEDDDLACAFAGQTKAAQTKKEG
jgi:hypothetical protein